MIPYVRTRMQNFQKDYQYCFYLTDNFANSLAVWIMLFSLRQMSSVGNFIQTAYNLLKPCTNLYLYHMIKSDKYLEEFMSVTSEENWSENLHEDGKKLIS